MHIRLSAFAAIALLAGCAATSKVAPIVPPPAPTQVIPAAAASLVSPPASTRPALPESSYLRDVRVSITEPTGTSVSAVEIVRMLRRQNINVVANLPLDGYTYGGLGFNDLDGYSALLALFGPMGLDFTVNESARLVELSPVRPVTWRLNIGDRTAKFETSGESAKQGTSGGSGGGQGGGGQGGGSSGSSGSGGGGVTGVTASANETSKSSLVSTEGFWAEMDSELERRMKVMVPKRTQITGGLQVPGSNDPIAPPSMLGGAVITERGMEEISVGRYSINKNTGAITIQAPRYLLSDIDTYLREVDAELNTMIVLEGLVLLVNNNDAESSGFDIAAFAKFATQYGLVVTNSALGGGLVVTKPVGGAVAAITAPGAVATTGLGVVSNDGLLQVFLAFLESKTHFKAVQRPYLATTSGVPAVFSQFDKQYLNQVSQEAAAGTASAAVAAKNTLIPFQFGTSIRIKPNYDKEHNGIRAQIALTQIVQSGTQAIDQIVNDATGTRTIRSQVPLDRTIDIQGEIFAPNNSLVILGGQIVDQDTETSSGIIGLGKILPGIFSNKQSKKANSTYYFALTMRTATEGQPAVLPDVAALAQ